MGRKVHPLGFRLGIIRGWDSNWYSEDNQPALVLEDTKLREYLQTRLRNGGLSSVIIERTPKRILLTLRTSRPGVIIGKGGEQIELLREELKKITNKEVIRVGEKQVLKVSSSFQGKVKTHYFFSKGFSEVGRDSGFNGKKEVYIMYVEANPSHDSAIKALIKSFGFLTDTYIE